VNYKDGCFCEEHLHLHGICGIIPCGAPVQPGGQTCVNPSHVEWHRKWVNQFKRLSYPGVRRVIHRWNATAEENATNPPAPENNNHATNPALHVQLPPLGDTPGKRVIHTFHAGTIYCIQTVQWACGSPIGWGKCYKSKSSPQVLAILDEIWASHPELKPSFMMLVISSGILSPKTKTANGYKQQNLWLMHGITSAIEAMIEPWIFCADCGAILLQRMAHSQTLCLLKKMTLGTNIPLMLSILRLLSSSTHGLMVSRRS
jgi:CxC6 like cysteine cluster associated with KDZ transposases